LTDKRQREGDPRICYRHLTGSGESEGEKPSKHRRKALQRARGIGEPDLQFQARRVSVGDGEKVETASSAWEANCARKRGATKIRRLEGQKKPQERREKT